MHKIRSPSEVLSLSKVYMSRDQSSGGALYKHGLQVSGALHKKASFFPRQSPHAPQHM